MSQVERIKQASIFPIGGSEDEAKQAVKQLFKKKSIDANLDSDFINNSNLEHDLKIEQLSCLLHKESLFVFGDGKPLTDGEEFNLSLLSKELKGVKIPNYVDLWRTPPTGLNDKEKERFRVYLECYECVTFNIFNNNLSEDVKRGIINYPDDYRKKMSNKYKNILIDIRKNYFEGK